MIRMCGKGEASAFMSFMRRELDENHIIANNKDFLDYFFYDKNKERYNIMCGFDDETGEIWGALAFYTTSFFDASIPPRDDCVWFSNWLVSEKARKAGGGAGLLLYFSLIDELKCENIGVLGLSGTAGEIYKKLKYKTGKLEQYFILNKKEYRAENAPALESLSGSALKEIEKFSVSRPKKTAEFIINKYLKSPYYKYYAYGVTGGEDNVLRGALIFKVQEYAEAGAEKRCIRIVEYFGEFGALSNKKERFYALLNEFNAEHMDFYCRGISGDILSDAGFEKNEGQIVIPNYFEPFVNKNIEIEYAYKLCGSPDNFAVFKGDGDREHPRTY